MATAVFQEIIELKSHPKAATKFILNILIENVWPRLIMIKSEFLSLTTNSSEIDMYVYKLKGIFMICCCQLKKSVYNIFNIFKLEHQKNLILQESRQCIIDRLIFCMDKMNAIADVLLNLKMENPLSDQLAYEDSSLCETPMYFVNWIDHTFELLTNLSNIVYMTNDKDSSELKDTSKNELIDCVRALHIAVDDLLVSAMTLSKYSLPNDQHAVTARCQVVLRETKALIKELVEGDMDKVYMVTKDSLKLPLMPSNINVLINVLKDVLYVLETNTNTALLTLLIDCCGCNLSPVDVLRAHFSEGAKGTCPCGLNGLVDVAENCAFVKQFDLYNERLSQIGTFAVSCSSDHKRILSLRSSLMSLEAFDPHLVPALMVSPGSVHSKLLADMWKQEVHEIQNNVFLIVDPTAFSEKCKDIMHTKLLDILGKKAYDNAAVCSIIDIGCVFYNFFEVYNKSEPEALTQRDSILSLMADLNKVLSECKIVSNMLSTCDQDFKYAIKCKGVKNETTFEKLAKRLKLLYTLLNRVNNLFNCKENDDQLLHNQETDMTTVDLTHTINRKSSETYVKNTPRRMTNNVSRSVLARTGEKPFSNRVPLSRLMKNLRVSKTQELSFSVQLDELFRAEKHTNDVVNKHLGVARDVCMSPRKDRSTLRKAVLNRNMKPLEVEQSFGSDQTGKDSFVDSKTNLQITEILDQIADISNALTATNPSVFNLTRSINTVRVNPRAKSSNILTLNINEGNASVSKRVWNIPVTGNSDSEHSLCTNISSASSQPSEVTTLERIYDLDLLENRLNDLKFLRHETNL